MADLVIRHGTIVDGTGAPAFTGDVAVTDGLITAVGEVDEGGDREIDAEGLTVTPGFVDIHTHFDGQATWDPVLAPSSVHGVTTLAMGNCGVGFAPARTDRHDWLIGLLEGVEDIPGTALAEGLTWDWETFPQYLDALDRRPHTVDLGVHVPHAALRTYVMGERGADHAERPTGAELARLALLVGEAVDAGAVGFATSRTEVHRTRDGARIPTLTAGADELLAVAEVLRQRGRGVIQLISDCYQTTDDELADAELGLMEQLVRASGRPLSFTVQQPFHAPERWRQLFGRVAELAAEGLPLKAQVAPRPIGVLLGLEGSANPFVACRSYAEVAALPLDERVPALRDPERRSRVLAEHAELLDRLPDGLFRQICGSFDLFFVLDDPVDYRLDPARSVGADAARLGLPAAGLTYDTLLRRGGRQLLYLPLFNFAHRSLDDVGEMLASPHALFGLSDAGAHCGAICDASFTTSSLVLWGRNRDPGPGPGSGRTFPIEWLVHGHTQRNARHLGWYDRGVVAPGHLADLNLIELGSLACHPPEIVHDLPAGGRRLIQRAEGYRSTIKAGVVTFVDGQPTGDAPGRLLRGPQPAPA
ncbi:MAG: amidohydrolase family protein [Acidimicrobiales bacterium]|nr:amidohydrolase family protein [Acidimicrobiales bacterium]